MGYKEVPIGSQYGHLTVLSLSSIRGHIGLVQWLCSCDCGKEVLIPGAYLLCGKRTSCGHVRSKEILTGKTFGQWIVIGPKEFKPLKDGRRRTVYLCKCSCGNEKLVNAAQLISGSTKSCRSCTDERLAATRRKPSGVAAHNAILGSYKTCAQARDLVWALSDERFDTITKQNCYYCGVSPSNSYQGSNYGRFVYNGIDRVNNSIGYVLENVVACCKVCNSAKRTMNQEEFISWTHRVADYTRKNYGPAIPIRRSL